MPFYEYACGHCGHRFEELIAYADRETAEQKLACPKCGGHELQRLVSMFAPTGAAQTSPPRHSCGSGG
jgi:putative FmdB family regulatory protein